MEKVIRQSKVNEMLVTLSIMDYGVYHVTACKNHSGDLYGYPIYENYTRRKDTANGYYYYLRRKYK